MRDLVFYPTHWVLDGNLSPDRQRRSRRLRPPSADDNAVLRPPVHYILPPFGRRDVRVYSLAEGQQHQLRTTRNKDKNSRKRSYMHPYRPLLMVTMAISLVSAGIIWACSETSTLE